MLAASLLAGGACARVAEPPKPRLVVVVCIDTLRADHVGAWGYDRDTTPVLDALARRGVRFEGTLSASPWTVPSVASVFTSLSPPVHGAGMTGEVRLLGETNPPRQIADGIPVLAESFRAAGFRTALLSANPFLYGRFRDGFDTANVERIAASELTDRALAWLAEGGDRPGFLYVQYMDVHQPNLPPDPYFQMFGAEPGNPNEKRHSDWNFGNVENPDDPAFREFRQHRIGTYDGALRYVDAELGRLLDRLDEPATRDRTLVAVFSDHGEEFWDHAPEQAKWRDDPRGFWGIGHGHTVYQELLAVPLVLSGPRFLGGGVVTCPTSLLDVAPTVLAAAGLPALPGAEGRDLAPLVLAPADAKGCRSRVRFAGSTAYGPDAVALFEERWKLVRAPGRPLALFDLRADPSERSNLADRHPEIVRSMARELERRTRVTTPGSAPPPNSTLEEEMRALGYI